MEIFLREPDFLVCDGWLPPEPLARLRGFLRGHAYFSVTKEGKRGPGGTLEELAGPLAGGVLRLLGGPFVVLRAVPGEERTQRPYPSGTPLDAVIESVQRALPDLRPWLGEPVKDWHRLGAGPRLYPRGRGMQEHDDADSVGTFALYVHERWEEGWGGELEIGGRRLRPEPNRCVFVKGGAPHRVLPVLDAAGPSLRTSVIGYTRRTKIPLE